MAMACGVDARSSGGGEASLRKVLRVALAGSVAAAALLTVAFDPASAAATTQRKPAHVKREAKKKEPPPRPLEQPFIEISISRQQLTLYDKDQVIAHAPVSTGMAGHLTPTGIFSVIGKEVFHRSNIYSGAPMPFMQRITWSGVAMHAGVLPGYPASHGCIRMPHDFAVRLYSLTRLGARVLVLPHEVAPASFESTRLFSRAMPATEKVGEAAPPADAKPANGVRTAESQTPVMSDAANSAAHALSGTAQAPQPAASAHAASEPGTGTVVVTPVPVTAPEPIEMRKSFEPMTGPG